jgi:hypothetical protein
VIPAKKEAWFQRSRAFFVRMGSRPFSP